MGALVFAGQDFGEFCRCKTVELRPQIEGGMTCKVKLVLDARAKLDVRATSALRHKLNALLSVKEGLLVLPEEEGLEYRGVSVTDANPWDELFDGGSTVITFQCADGIAYGDERVSGVTELDVNGTAATYPVFEMIAAEGDSVMVLDLDAERFVNVVSTFEGGELVVIDCEQETVTIDGENADASVGFYSDFFSLRPGANNLEFAGCTSHTMRYRERWL